MCLICQMQYDDEHTALQQVEKKDPDTLEHLPFICRRCKRFPVEEVAAICYHCFGKESHLDSCEACAA